MLLSGHFDPYQTLIASEMSSFPTTPQARLVLSEAFSAIELFAGAMVWVIHYFATYQMHRKAPAFRHGDIKVLFFL